MPSGTLCPKCSEPVMSYSRFIREAEPWKTSRCSHCNAELKRKKSVWVLLAAGVAVAAPITGFGIPFMQARWGAAGVAALVVITVAVFAVVLNVCGWLFVGWEPVASAESEAGSAERPQARNASQHQ